MKTNIRYLNKLYAISMLAGVAIVSFLIMLDHVGYFDFSGSLSLSLPILGYSVSILPIVLWLLKVPDNFLRYFMAIAMSVFIGSMGCYNAVGIYITYILVPVASCLYFDKLYTLFCTVISYLVMFVAVYFNTSVRAEVAKLGMDHSNIFWAYMIGFTLEYIIVSIFLFQIIKRAEIMLDEQHKMFIAQKSQDARHQILIKEIKDVVFEYYPKQGRYVANRSIYQKPEEANKAVEYKNFNEIVNSNPELQNLNDRVISCFLGGKFKACEIDMSYVLDGKKVPLWFFAECFLVKDEDEPVCVVGKLHDITRLKEAQESMRRQSLERLATDPRRENTLYQQIMAESKYFKDDDFKKLAAGHGFLAQILEDAKYIEEYSAGIMKILSMIGAFFALDRICVVETDMSSGTNAVNYQWNRKEEDYLENYFTQMSKEDIRLATEGYDKYGCLEVNPSKGIVTVDNGSQELMDSIVYGVILGNQIWIPMMSNGKYIGAISFDRCDTTPYTSVEKFLLSEAVNSLTTLILKINADNENKAKSDFLSTMSHEIRTPMNAIVGLTEVSLREDMPEGVKNNLMTVKSSAFGLLTLINDILDYSKIQAGRFDIVPEDFSLLSILNDVKEMTEARNKGKLDVHFNIPSDLPTKVHGDSVRIKQVMINYCSNAVKYSDEGSVEINTSIEKTDEQNAFLHFSVKDSGIGIKKEDLPKLFKSYTRVDTTVNHHKEGTGLGLAICKQLVELMDGTVNVESEYGKGSTFSFVIPLKVIDWAEAGRIEDYKYEDIEETQEETVPLAPDARVLIVDDNRVNLMVAKALMKVTRVHITTADSGFEALDILKQNDFDMVFMDHFMPDMDGVETTAKIRELPDEKYKRLPIVALTADAMSGVREELLSKGMNDFLTKPIMVKNLYRILRSWIPKDKIQD